MTARVSISHLASGAAVIIGVLVAVACASAGGPAAAQRRANRCALNAKDSVFLAGGPVYRDCAVDRKAESLVQVHPDFRPDPMARCYSAGFEFVVSATGLPLTETARLIRATDRRFADAVAATIPRLKFRPAELGGAPVRQIVDYKSAMQSVVIAVPAGSAPPTPQPPTTPPPC